MREPRVRTGRLKPYRGTYGRRFLRARFLARAAFNRFFSPGFRLKVCFFASRIISSCCTFRLKRRRALSRDSPSCKITSAKSFTSSAYNSLSELSLSGYGRYTKSVKHVKAPQSLRTIVFALLAQALEQILLNLSRKFRCGDGLGNLHRHG